MELDETRQARIAAALTAFNQALNPGITMPPQPRSRRHEEAMGAAIDAADAAAHAVEVTVEEAGKLISDLVNTWDRIPKSVLDPEYERKWIAYLDVRDRMMDALLTAHPEPGSTTAGDW